MSNKYEVMKHNLEHNIGEQGVKTLLIQHQDGSIALRYHQTDVVTAYPDGTVKLDNGGFQTNTTKERINRYLPDGHQLYQEKKKWWIATPNGVVPYENGMTLPIKPTRSALAEAYENHQFKEAERAKDFGPYSW